MTLIVMQAFTYATDRQEKSSNVPMPTSFLRLTVADFGISSWSGLYMLWSFARTDGLALDEVIPAMLVLGCLASVGPAASRMML